MKLQHHHIAIPLALTLLWGCAASDEASTPGSESETPVGGGSVTVVELGDMDKPLPLIYANSTDGGVIDMTYMSILAARWEDGILKYQTAAESPLAIARSYEFFGPDSASLRYHFRSDLKWSDGQPITAEDAKFTFDLRADPRTASPRQDYSRQIKSVVVENDSTLVINFTKRYPEVFFHTSDNIIPKHLYEGTDPSQLRSHPALLNPEGGKMVVSGPYMVGEWLRGERIVLVPNPEFKPQPYIQRIVIRPIPEETTRMVELQTGNADVMEIPFDKIELVRTSTPNVRFEYQRRRFYDYIAYNPKAHPAFADKDVRRALGMAIDVPQLIQALSLQDRAEPAGGPYTPIFKLLYDPVGQAPLKHDSAEAARILDSKGWVLGPDGVRAKGGRKLSFSLTTNAGNQRRADIAQIVQQEWRSIGVEARVQTIESVTFFDRLQKKELEAAIPGWSVGLAADISDQWTGDNVFNYTSYNNPEVMKFFQQALAQPTEELAAPFWKQAAALIVADQPYTWLFYFDQVVGVNNRVHGTRIDALGKYQNVYEWWIPTELQGTAGGRSGN